MSATTILPTVSRHTVGSQLVTRVFVRVIRVSFFFLSFREQYDREQALDDFKTGRARVLIATDVASRGLDVKDITYVLLFYTKYYGMDAITRASRESASKDE